MAHLADGRAPGPCRVSGEIHRLRDAAQLPGSPSWSYRHTFVRPSTQRRTGAERGHVLLERRVRLIDVSAAPERHVLRPRHVGYYPRIRAATGSTRPERVQKRPQMPVTQTVAQEQEILIGEVLRQFHRNELRQARHIDTH